MRPFNLNDEEIAHITRLRALTGPQHELVYYLVDSLARAAQPIQALPSPSNVTPLRSCPGK